MVGQLKVGDKLRFGDSSQEFQIKSSAPRPTAFASSSQAHGSSAPLLPLASTLPILSRHMHTIAADCAETLSLSLGRQFARLQMVSNENPYTKAIKYLLRHSATEAGLEVRPDGYVKVRTKPSLFSRTCRGRRSARHAPARGKKKEAPSSRLQAQCSRSARQPVTADFAWQVYELLHCTALQTYRASEDDLAEVRRMATRARHAQPVATRAAQRSLLQQRDAALHPGAVPRHSQRNRTCCNTAQSAINRTCRNTAHQKETC
jgi:hypothetical protein